MCYLCVLGLRFKSAASLQCVLIGNSNENADRFQSVKRILRFVFTYNCALEAEVEDQESKTQAKISAAVKRQIAALLLARTEANNSIDKVALTRSKLVAS